MEWLLTALVGYLSAPIDRNNPPPGYGMAARRKLAAALEAGVAKMRAADPAARQQAFLEGLRTCHAGVPFPARLERSLVGEIFGGKILMNSGFDGLEWIRMRLDERRSVRSGARRVSLVAAWSDARSIREALAEGLNAKIPSITELMDDAEKNPPDPAVLAAAWEALTTRSQNGPLPARIVAFGGMFRLAGRMPATERSTMRESFLRFFRKHLLATEDWPGWMLESAATPVSARGGAGIPWEPDALSAALSWWSEIGEETYGKRQTDAAATATGCFSYIAQAYVDFEGFSGRIGAPDLNQLIRAREWPRKPSPGPHPATPWQRARALHTARPDLHFPDRNLPRPRTGITMGW